MLRESFTPYGQPPDELSYEAIDAMGPYPPNPLLGRQELGSITDLRHLIPVMTRRQLTPDETVVRVNDLTIPRLTRPPSNLRIAMALAGVASMSQVGENGPMIAALPGSEDPADTAMNRFTAPHFRDAVLAAKLRVRRVGPSGEIVTPLKFPKLMRATLTNAAEGGGIIDEQYRDDAPYRQEKPGRVMLVNFGLEDPGGRKFSKYLGWGWPIYTSVDACPLFVSECSDYVAEEESDFLSTPYTARDGQEHPMGQFFDLAVDRLLADLDASKDGFIEFKNLALWGGMINQAWSDSAGAYTHVSGEWANHNDGIAAVEVQGYTYDALTKAARIYRDVFLETERADKLEQAARDLQRNFLDKFFATDEKGTYAVMGRDYDDKQVGRQLAVRHVNIGLLLESGILDGDEREIVSKREAIIGTLFSPSMMTRYGLRTLDENEVAYRPGGDHVGQIWPHINEAVARGLIKYGHYGLARYLRTGNWLIYMESHAAPEYIRGDSTTQALDNQQEIVVWNSRYGRMYMLEIAGQRYQAWANEAVLAGKYDYSALGGPRRLPIKATDPAKRRLEVKLLASLPPQDQSMPISQAA